MEIIKMENIAKLYKLGQVQVEALKNVSLSINDKEFVSIMGPSGSGNSRSGLHSWRRTAWAYGSGRL